MVSVLIFNGRQHNISPEQYWLCGANLMQGAGQEAGVAVQGSVRYFSVGEFCETAYQIRRHTGDQAAYFFDWLVSSPASLYCMCEPMGHFLEAGRWTLCDRDTRVLDLATGLRFQHEFDVLAEDMARAEALAMPPRVDADRVEAHLPAAREKFRYLREKTRMAIMQASSCVLVRTEHGLTTPSQARIRVRQLQDIFLPFNPGLKIIITSSMAQQEVLGEDFIFARIGTGAEWYGDHASWDRVFALAAQAFDLARPAAVTTPA
ncbi:hypothetical protein SAMN02745857_04081 [Andreprevotia lacus DSM 23236]|jgi:hypothetical protein|uniref:Uncharacterized protein n=1 Tax=Andreprevotia lacus DSM 23236 TaxID=1121001 RepID=A0A1W1Y1R9_9NEIS|nr:hypothetical protein [Andreprevotia lacus]SMC29741.1 hypothetical protein SAMN02745857_04081 [Andreprevotia lacus DSM 23236]